MKQAYQYAGSILGSKADWSEAYEQQPDYNWIINPTAQVVKVEKGQIVSRFCTAFLIDKRRLLTAGHCIEGMCEAFDATTHNLNVVFNYQLASEEEEQKARPYQINKVLEHGKCKETKVDYAIFELASQSAYDAFGAVKLSFEAQVGNKIVLAHHPEGQHKKVSFGKLMAKNGLFKHSGDTLGGSSGAPLGREASSTAVGIHIRGASGSGDYNKAVPLTDVAASSEIVSQFRL